MFWKLALLVVVPLLLYGRPSLLKHPLVRFFLPKTWWMRASELALPGRPPEKPSPAPRPARSPSTAFSRAYITLLVLAAVAVASWMLMRLMITQT